MSTRSNIVLKRKNGKIDVIYCHYSGYPTHNGYLLLQYYNDIDKIKELIENGDLSELNVTVDSNNTYGTGYREYNTLEEYLDKLNTLWIEYIYIFDEIENKWLYTKTNKWFRKKCYNIKDIKELTWDIVKE